jgi:hypothetical protein
VQVEEDPAGLPTAVKTAHLNLTAQTSGPAVKAARKQAVLSIEDAWRIDDEWWRSEPVSRLYYAVLFRSGQRLVIYKDLNNGKWYRQTY